MQGFKCGSSTIEAALVIPLLFLIIAGIIKIGITYQDRVKESSAEHVTDAGKYFEDNLTNVEDVLRGRWILN